MAPVHAHSGYGSALTKDLATHSGFAHAEVLKKGEDRSSTSEVDARLVALERKMSETVAQLVK